MEEAVLVHVGQTLNNLQQDIPQRRFRHGFVPVTTQHPYTMQLENKQRKRKIRTGIGSTFLLDNQQPYQVCYGYANSKRKVKKQKQNANTNN